MRTLEQEFTEAVFTHKSAIVMGTLLKFYNDVANTGVTIPEFMGKSAEEQAKEHYFSLLADRNRFNETYEKCWEKYGGLLP